MSSPGDVDYFGNLNALGVSELRSTLGAMLLGGFVCIFLSGIVTMQAYLYFRVYQKDALRFRVTVFALWSFDVLHSAMVCVTIWLYAIAHFGDTSHVDVILWSVAFSIALTAITTFIVHIFFTHRLHAISNSNLYMTAPMVILALLRVAVALVTTVKMIQLGSFRKFINEIDWVFTMGLSVSAVIDIAIAVGLCYFLRKHKSGFSSMDQLIDSLILYTVESGVVTCAVTIVSLICWTTMSDNLIFMGLHFTISKLYANSLLATLNSRKSLKIRSQASSDKEHPFPILLPGRVNRRGRFSLSRHSINPTSTLGQVEINVQKTIQIDDEIVDGGLPLDASPVASSSDVRKSKGTIS